MNFGKESGNESWERYLIVDGLIWVEFQPEVVHVEMRRFVDQFDIGDLHSRGTSRTGRKQARLPR